MLALCRTQLGSELGWRDDFVEWGAHSIAIAQLTQTLQSAGYPVTVRALLSEYRCAADIAALTCAIQPQAGLASSQPNPPTLDDAEVESRVYSFRSFSALQASASVLLRVPLVLVAGLGLAIIDPEVLLLAGDVLGFLGATIISYCLYMIVPFVNLSWVVLLRLIQRGNGIEATLEPGRYQKYSRHHLQVWWMEQQAGFVLRPLVNGLRSPNLFNWALRRLGAHIHPGTFIAQSTEWYGPLSLMTIEEGAVIQAGAQISTIEWESSVFTLKRHTHWPPRSSGESSHGVRRRHSRGGFVVNALVVATKRLRRLFTSQWCSRAPWWAGSSSENARSAAAQRTHHGRHRCAQCPATAGTRTVISGDPRRVYRAHRVVFSRLWTRSIRSTWTMLRSPSVAFSK